MLLKKNDCEVQEKHCVKISTRDYNLDFYKGLASISIVFIHTAFYSGESYIPSIMRMIYARSLSENGSISMILIGR